MQRQKHSFCVNLPKYKVVTLGSVGVGKTSLLARIALDSDVAPALSNTCTKVPFGNLGQEMQIWDLGSEGHPVDICRGAKGAILVYDVTRKDTFEKIRNLVDTVRKVAGSKVTIALIGNKVDLVEKDPAKREVPCEDGRNLQLQLMLDHFAEVCSTNCDKSIFDNLFEAVMEPWAFEALTDRTQATGKERRSSV